MSRGLENVNTLKQWILLSLKVPYHYFTHLVWILAVYEQLLLFLKPCIHSIKLDGEQSTKIFRRRWIAYDSWPCMPISYDNIIDQFVSALLVCKVFLGEVVQGKEVRRIVGMFPAEACSCCKFELVKIDEVYKLTLVSLSLYRQRIPLQKAL